MTLRIPRFTLTARLLAVLLPIVLLTVASTGWIAVSGSRAVVDRFANNYGRGFAEAELSFLGALTRQMMEPVEGVARTVRAVVASGTGNRRLISDWARDAAAARPALLALWFVGEPDSLGRDADNRRGDPTVSSAQSGRTMIYWARDRDGVVRFSPVPEPVEDQDWYAAPRRAGRLTVIPAYDYPVHGRSVRLFTYALPVYADGRLVGIAGADMETAELTRQLDQRHPLGGDIYIVDSRRAWGYHPDHSRITRPVSEPDARTGLTAWEQEQISAGLPYSLDRTDGQGRRFRRFALAPEGPNGRILIADLPLDVLLAPFDGIGQAILAMGVLAAALLVAATALTIRLLVAQPLTRLRSVVAAFGAGELTSAVPDTGRADAVGDIARALEAFRQSLLDRAQLRRSLDERTADLERMAAGIAAARDGIVVLDRGMAVIYANPATLRLLGAPPDAPLVGRHWFDTLDAATRQAAARDMERVAQELHRRAHWAGATEDFGTVYGARVEAMEWTVSLLSSGDLLMMLRDVSEPRRAARERERMEQQLLQQDKMEAIGRMAGGIAHDFNNLLGAMLGYAEFLVSDLPKGSPEHEYAARLTKVGERAKDLVRQILTFARSDSQALAPVALDAVVTDAQTILRSAVPAMTQLSFAVEPGLPAVRANATQLVQVLMNLVLNAHDATRLARPPGVAGRIEVRVHRGGSAPPPDDGRDRLVALPFVADGPHVVVEVEDDGQGMSSDTMRRIFEPFFTTKDKGKGTGLGMPLVYGIVKAHGGGLELCSAEGRGTLVRVRLPAAAEPAAARPEAPPPAIAGQRHWRVLVVDDEPAMGDMLREGLRRHGHKVFVCNDPHRALRMMQADPRAFDAVVTDQAMPAMTGLELIGALKVLRPGLPCLLYTGYSERANEQSARAAGADAFLFKPVVVADVLARLDDLAGRAV